SIAPLYNLYAPSSTVFPYTTLFRSLKCMEHFCQFPQFSCLLSTKNASIPSFLQVLSSKNYPFFSKTVVRGRTLPYDFEAVDPMRSEEHTSELQSRENLVCRLLLEKQ